MEPQERLVNSQSTSSCVKVLAEAYEIYKTFRNQRVEIERFENSKSLLKNESTFERYIFQKNENTIANMEKATTKLKTRLKILDEEIITQAVDKLTREGNCGSNLDISLLLPGESELRKAVGISTILKNEEDKKQRIDTITETKLDKEDISKNIEDFNKEMEEMLRGFSRSNETYLEASTQQYTLEIEKLLQRNTPSPPDEFFQLVLDESLHRLFGTQSEREIRNECNVEAMVKQSLTEHLGRKFVAHLLGSMPSKPTLYPVNDTEQSIQSLQVRDSGASNIKVKKPEKSKLKKSLAKIAKMENECDDMLLLFDANLNSWSVRKLFDNLAYIDRVTKNHKQVLNTISNPCAEVKEPLSPSSVEILEDEDIDEPEDEAEDEREDDGEGEKVPKVPSHIKLYAYDNCLSTIMATSLTEYTKQLYFSDLTQRVENLDKKLQ
ncbi:unnamed protein product [Mucor hiemalis]